MNERWVFVDRDGTLIENVPELNDPRRLCLLPGVAGALKKLQKNGYKIAVVSNQAAVGRGKVSLGELFIVDLYLMMKLVKQGVLLDTYTRYCVHTPEENCGCRKPKIGLFTEIINGDEAIAIIGDNDCDVNAGKALGIKTILVRTGHGKEVEERHSCSPDHVVDTLEDAADLLVGEKHATQATDKKSLR